MRFAGFPIALLAWLCFAFPLNAAQDVKTEKGLAIASVKTVNGLAIASVKTIIGTDNTASGGSPAFVGFQRRTGGAAASSATHTITRTFGAGNLIVIGCTWMDANETCSVADPTNGSYTGVGAGPATAGPNQVQTRFFYKPNVAAGSTTVTMTLGNAQFSQMYMWEFSGCSTTTPLDDADLGQNVNWATMATADITTTAANTALVCVAGNFSGFTATHQTNWTEDDDSVDGIEGQHRMVTSTGTFHGEAVVSSNTVGTICVAAFK
jgi:hypothetical protein